MPWACMDDMQLPMIAQCNASSHPMLCVLQFIQSAQLVNVVNVKTSKHGHAKAVMTGACIFDGSKVEGSCQTNHNVDQPVVHSSVWTVLTFDAEEGTCRLINDDGETREDVVVDQELEGSLGEQHKQIVEALEKDFTVTVKLVEAMDREALFFVQAQRSDLA